MLEQSGPPPGQILKIIALNRVLILRVPQPGSDAQILHPLQIERRSRHRRQFWPQTIDQLICADVALLERLQRHKYSAGIRRRACPAACKGHHVGYGRISSNNVYEARNPLPHRLKGRILGTLNASNDAPGILLRKKSFRHNDEEIDIHADREQENTAASRPRGAGPMQGCARTGAIPKGKLPRSPDRVCP